MFSIENFSPFTEPLKQNYKTRLAVDSLCNPSQIPPNGKAKFGLGWLVGCLSLSIHIERNLGKIQETNSLVDSQKWKI